MAKGRTSLPLRILVAPEFAASEGVRGLQAQGHHVVVLGPGFGIEPGETTQFDLILHPAAHWWSEDMWPYLPAALTAARKRRKARTAA